MNHVKEATGESLK